MQNPHELTNPQTHLVVLGLALLGVLATLHYADLVFLALEALLQLVTTKAKDTHVLKFMLVDAKKHEWRRPTQPHTCPFRLSCLSSLVATKVEDTHTTGSDPKVEGRGCYSEDVRVHGTNGPAQHNRPHTHLCHLFLRFCCNGWLQKRKTHVHGLLNTIGAA